MGYRVMMKTVNLYRKIIYDYPFNIDNRNSLLFLLIIKGEERIQANSLCERLPVVHILLSLAIITGANKASSCHESLKVPNHEPG